MKETAFFTDLYLQYYPAALQYALRYCEGKSDAEDIVQNVFVKLVQKGSAVMVVENWNSYLFIMVRNETMNYFRREKLQRQLLTETMWRDMNITTHDKLLEKEYRKTLQAAIERLPARRRKIFQLSFELGMKIEMIAEELNISSFTVKNQLQEARNEVREYVRRKVA